MVKGKGKVQHNFDITKQKPWPIVTSNVCENCPIQCSAGVAYMERVRTSGQPTKGVVCKKSMYEERIKQGLPPFGDTSKLWKAPR